MKKDEKLKPLRPTLRVKKRFLKIQLHSTTPFDFKTISEELTQELLKYLGGITFSKAGIWLLRDKFSQKEQQLILKVNLDYKNEVLGALSIISNFSKQKVKLEVLKVSGTLKGLKKD